jgi:hypothetical protein
VTRRDATPQRYEHPSSALMCFMRPLEIRFCDKAFRNLFIVFELSLYYARVVRARLEIHTCVGRNEECLYQMP